MSKFDTVEDLYEFISNISYEEYYRRIMLCIKNMIEFIKKNPEGKNEQMENKLVDKLIYIMEN